MPAQVHSFTGSQLHRFSRAVDIWHPNTVRRQPHNPEWSCPNSHPTWQVKGNQGQVTSWASVLKHFASITGQGTTWLAQSWEMWQQPGASCQSFLAIHRDSEDVHRKEQVPLASMLLNVSLNFAWCTSCRQSCQHSHWVTFQCTNHQINFHPIYDSLNYTQFDIIIATSTKFIKIPLASQEPKESIHDPPRFAANAPSGSKLIQGSNAIFLHREFKGIAPRHWVTQTSTSVKGQCLGNGGCKSSAYCPLEVTKSNQFILGIRHTGSYRILLHCQSGHLVTRSIMIHRTCFCAVMCQGEAWGYLPHRRTDLVAGFPAMDIILDEVMHGSPNGSWRQEICQTNPKNAK